MNGAERIAAERKRQIEEEEFTAEQDDSNRGMALAAACYALPWEIRRIHILAGPAPQPLGYFLWPWDLKHWKPTPGNRIRELEKAGALIAAEIDRLLRLEEKEKIS